MAPSSRGKGVAVPTGLEVQVVKGLLGDFVCSVFVDPSTDLKSLQAEIGKATGLAPFQLKLLRRGVPPERLPLVHLDDLSLRGLSTRLKDLLPEEEKQVRLMLIIRQQEEAEVLSKLLDRDFLLHSWQPGWLLRANSLMAPWWESHDVVKAAVGIQGFRNAMELASQELKDTEDIILTALKCHEDSWCFASERLRQDPETLCRAAAINTKMMKHVAQKDYAIRIVSTCGLALQHAPKEFQDDEDVVRAATADDPTTLRFASKRLRDHKNLVLSCIARNGDTLRYASNTLKNDEEVVRAAITSDGCALGHASASLRGQKELVLLATSTCSTALSCTTEEVRADKRLMQQVISRCPTLLGMAAASLRNDLELVLLAVRANGDSLRHASQDMRGNVTAVLAAVSKDPDSLQHCTSKQAVLAAASIPGCSLESVPKTLRDDRDVIRAFKYRAPAKVSDAAAD